MLFPIATFVATHQTISVKVNMGRVNGSTYVDNLARGICFNMNPEVYNKPKRKSEKELGFLEKVCRVRFVAGENVTEPDFVR